MGFSVADGPEIEDEFSTFYGYEYAGKPPCTRYAGHVLCRRCPGHVAAYAHVAGTGQGDGKSQTIRSLRRVVFIEMKPFRRALRAVSPGEGCTLTRAFLLPT